MSEQESYRHYLAYTAKYMDVLTLGLEEVCEQAAIANIPWETRRDMIDEIDAVVTHPLCALEAPLRDALLALRSRLDSLPEMLWNARIEGVAHCIRTFEADEWARIRTTCREMVPAMRVECERAGMTQWWRDAPGLGS